MVIDSVQKRKFYVRLHECANEIRILSAKSGNAYCVPEILYHRLTDSSRGNIGRYATPAGTSHPGYLGMLGGSGGCVAARNSGARPRKIASIRAANSTRPPPRQEPPVILEHFVVPSLACVTVPRVRYRSHAK